MIVITAAVDATAADDVESALLLRWRTLTGFKFGVVVNACVVVGAGLLVVVRAGVVVVVVVVVVDVVGATVVVGVGVVVTVPAG